MDAVIPSGFIPVCVLCAFDLAEMPKATSKEILLF